MMAGLTRDNNKSAGKKKSVHIARFGVHLPALIEVVYAVVKDNKSPYYKQNYDNTSKRRGKKRAIIVIARMILTTIYSTLCIGQV